MHAAEAQDVAQVVKLSQLAATADSPVRFLRYHAAIESALSDSRVGWTFVRPNLILQAYLAFAPAIAHGALQAPIGETPVSVVDARDIAAVAAAALTGEGHVGQTYTLTGPAAVSHPELTAIIANAIDRTVAFERVSAEDFVAALTGMGMPSWQAEGLAEDYAHYDRGEAAFISPDVQRVTGTRAHSVSDFISEYRNAFSGN